MNLKLEGIKQPEKTGLLWRYMSFESFVNLLSERSLFFARVDKFEDPFEGFTPPSVTEHFEREIKNAAILEKIQENLHKYTFCSCWHHAPNESMAMWEKYHMHNSGIVIKTTFDNFIDCFVAVDEDVFMGNIEYINPYEYSVPQNIKEMSMLYTWYFHKRKPFKHEEEFRAIVTNYPGTLRNYIDKHGNLIHLNTTKDDIEFPEIHKDGIQIKINVSKLIDEVITSPYSKDWITDTVRSVVKQYGFDLKVKHSTILDVPTETN